MDTAFTVALTTSPIAFAAMRVRRAMGVATFAAFGGDAIAAGSFSMGFGVGSSGDARQANGLRVACIGEIAEGLATGTEASTVFLLPFDVPNWTVSKSALG